MKFIYVLVWVPGAGVSSVPRLILAAATSCLLCGRNAAAEGLYWAGHALDPEEWPWGGSGLLPWAACGGCWDQVSILYEESSHFSFHWPVEARCCSSCQTFPGHESTQASSLSGWPAEGTEPWICWYSDFWAARFCSGHGENANSSCWQTFQVKCRGNQCHQH